MSVYRGRPSISLTGSAVAGPFIGRRQAVKPRHALVALAIALACLALGIALRENPGRAARSAAAGAPAHTYRQEGMLSLPAAAQAPVSAALGEDSPAYRLTPAAGGYRAHSAAQRLALRFTRSGVSVRSHHGVLGLALRGIGHGSRLRPVGASDPTAAANRVSYALAGGLREWYANGPLGLEQGFDLEQAPAGRGGPLTLSLAVSGNLHARLTNGGLRLSGHGAALRYAGLVARDSRGRELHAWLELRRQTLLIRIDDGDARYPLRIDPWVQSAELTPSDASAGDRFGYSVAVSGNTVVVGEPAADDGAGAAYVFTRGTGGWVNTTQTAKLTPSNPETGDAFGGQQLGQAVAIDGSTIVAGAPYWTQYSNSGNIEYAGAVYVWTLPKSGVWTNATQTAYLTATNLGQNDYLGASVAVQGSTIVAGAPNHIFETPLGGPGSVYVYTMPASGGWVNASQTAQLSGYDEDAGDALGASVAISGSTIVAGAPIEEYSGTGNYAARGGVYVWTEPLSGVWVNASAVAELIPADAHANDEVGTSVAISGSTIVAGAPNHSIANRAQGTAYVWTLPPIGGWGNATQPAELTSTDLSGGLVGESVAVSGNTVFSGGGLSITTERGAVYEWTRPASGFWANETQVATLTPSDSAGADLFGDRIALSNSTLVVGAWGAGNAYVFGGGYTLSGTVYGQRCGQTCNRSGLPGVKVLVKGTAMDGTTVSQTAVTAADGTWSLVVPPGQYTAGPTQDGVTFGPPGVDPADVQVTVTNADVPNLNFVVCAESATSSDSRDDASRRIGDRLRGHATSSDLVDLCHSVYTFTINAALPNSNDALGHPLPPTEFGGSYLVDPSSQARYSERSDPRTPDYRDSSGVINLISHTAPFRQTFLKGREYPACMSEQKIEELDHEGLTGTQVDWYSYISGGQLGSYAVQLQWDQSNQQLSLVGSPTATRGWLYRVFNWTAGDEHGSCYLKAKAQMVVLPVFRGGQFTIAMAWGFPYLATGVTAEDSEFIRKLVDRNIEYWGHKLGEAGQALVDTYKGSPEAVKFALELGIALATTKGAFSLIEMGPEEIRTLYGLISEEQALQAIKYADYFHIGHSVGELINFLGAYGGEYPVMTALVRGRFYNKPLPAGFSGDTQLGVSMGASKFPNISFIVQRDVLDVRNAAGQEPKSGLLLWSNQLAPKYTNPATADHFASADWFYLNRLSPDDYFASGKAAVSKIEEDTKALPGVKTSIRDGNLGVDFNQYRSEVGTPPSCALSGGLLLGSAAPSNAICWVFGDGRA